ncbi:MAG: aldolase/citrate lyase family protein [Planctomycetaceae bacterium]
MVERIKDRLDRGETVMAIGVGRVLHHNFLQVLGIGDSFHCVWFDSEHVGFSIESLEVNALAARSVGLDNFVRIAPTDYATVTRSLEAGGGGIMAAQVFSAAQAEEIVQWCKFHPRGHRGLNTGGFDARFGTMSPAEFTEQANRETFVAIQIETTQSVEEVDQIAAIDGVDLLFIGPSDLSQSLGVTGDFFHEKCIDAIDRVSAACEKHGKHIGAVVVNPEHAAMMHEKGVRLISPTSDVKLLHAGIAAIRGQYEGFYA